MYLQTQEKFQSVKVTKILTLMIWISRAKAWWPDMELTPKNNFYKRSSKLDSRDFTQISKKDKNWRISMKKRRKKLCKERNSSIKSSIRGLGKQKHFAFISWRKSKKSLCWYKIVKSFRTKKMFRKWRNLLKNCARSQPLI